MLRELRDSWVSELRDPTNLQGQIVLKQQDGRRCCLGVLCDLVEVPYSFERSRSQTPQLTHKYRARYNFFSEGKKFTSISSPPAGFCSLEKEDIINLVTLNDEKAYSFSQIADWIVDNIKVEEDNSEETVTR
jgi:hypothetical protein